MTRPADLVDSMWKNTAVEPPMDGSDPQKRPHELCRLTIPKVESVESECLYPMVKKETESGPAELRTVQG